jgi:hypothetical protein
VAPRVGGGAADVADDRVVEAGEVCGADQAGRWTGEDRLDRAFTHEVGRHQRAVAAHHHHGGVHAVVDQRLLGRGHQPIDDRHQTCVQDRRHRSLRTIELRGQHMARGHRLAGEAPDEFHCRQLVCRVADAELRHHGEPVDPIGHLADPLGQEIEVERRAFPTVRVVAAGEQHCGIAPERSAQATALDHVVVEADDDRAHRTSRPLDECVGGECGRQRHELDRRGRNAGRAERRIDRTADADAEVVVGGRRLRLRDDRARSLVVHDGVGVGATGVDAEEEMARRRGRRNGRRGGRSGVGHASGGPGDGSG